MGEEEEEEGGERGRWEGEARSDSWGESLCVRVNVCAWLLLENQFLLMRAEK